MDDLDCLVYISTRARRRYLRDEDGWGGVSWAGGVHGPRVQTTGETLAGEREGSTHGILN